MSKKRTKDYSHALMIFTVVAVESVLYVFHVDELIGRALVYMLRVALRAAAQPWFGILVIAVSASLLSSAIVLMVLWRFGVIQLKRPPIASRRVSKVAGQPRQSRKATAAEIEEPKDDTRAIDLLSGSGSRVESL